MTAGHKDAGKEWRQGRGPEQRKSKVNGARIAESECRRSRKTKLSGRGKTGERSENISSAINTDARAAPYQDTTG